MNSYAIFPRNAKAPACFASTGPE